MESLPDKWLTLFEVLEQTELPVADIQRLAEEGVLTTRKAGAAVLYAADDVRRVAATGRALIVPPSA